MWELDGLIDTAVYDKIAINLAKTSLQITLTVTKSN